MHFRAPGEIAVQPRAPVGREQLRKRELIEARLQIRRARQLDFAVERDASGAGAQRAFGHEKRISDVTQSGGFDCDVGPAGLRDKPLAAIETARTVSGMHLAKARNAAVSGDKATLESELKEATEIWPRNPALAKVSGLIFRKLMCSKRRS